LLARAIISGILLLVLAIAAIGQIREEAIAPGAQQMRNPPPWRRTLDMVHFTWSDSMDQWVGPPQRFDFCRNSTAHTGGYRFGVGIAVDTTDGQESGYLLDGQYRLLKITKNAGDATAPNGTTYVFAVKAAAATTQLAAVPWTAVKHVWYPSSHVEADSASVLVAYHVPDGTVPQNPDHPYVEVWLSEVVTP
jgi:hypothetical protein